MAGGLTPFASPQIIKVVRKVAGRTKSIYFDYKDVSKGHLLGQNIILQPGDVVVVP